ncbi:DUF805 domain-containing protein [Loktanella sp. Alg231-35]|uniref:DUF805 domain-containing protein n=1 Tax=Loktanella sp. Alg231-35 TaxID=1922220 RepID=UPI000D5597E4
MGPLEAIKTGLAKSFQFKGRASRSEFWWYYIFGSLITLLLFSLNIAAGLLLKLATLVPMHSCAVRRLRDQESWEWEILILSPVLLVTNLLVSVSLEDGFYKSHPYAFLGFACVWVLCLSRAYWILTGSSKKSDPNPHEVPL